MERFRSWLDRVSTQIETDREVWVLGDFNCDLTRKDDNSYNRKNLSQLAHNELVCRGMTQLIEGGTHRQQDSISTIDLVFTYEPRKVIKSGKSIWICS